MALPTTAVLPTEHSMDGTQFSASGTSALASDVSDVESAASSLPVVTVVATVDEAPPKRKGKGKAKMLAATKVPAMPEYGKTRRRKRDGKIVPKSSLNKHYFKIAKRELRRHKLAPLSHRDDLPSFDPKHAVNFVHLRRHVAIELVALLLKAQSIDQEVHDMVNSEVDSAHEVLLEHAVDYKHAHFGSVVEWVILLSQQAKLLQMGRGEWEMTSVADIERWTADKLFALFHSHSAFRLTPMPPSPAPTAATLSSLLQKAFSGKHAAELLSPLRRSMLGADWVHADIAAGTPPKKIIDMGMA